MTKFERFELAIRELVNALDDLPLDVAVEAEYKFLGSLELALDRRARKRVERWTRIVESTGGLLS